MKKILQLLASILIVYLGLCLLSLSWTPGVANYISFDISGRMSMLILIASFVFLVYAIIELIKLFTDL